MALFLHWNAYPSGLEDKPCVLQVAIHCIGDRAVDELLAIHARIPGGGPTLRLPHRIEHAQHLSGPNATNALSRLGLNVVANPQHLVPDQGIVVQQLGAERSGHGRSFAFGSLQQVRDQCQH